jgi:hypothetical protein
MPAFTPEFLPSIAAHVLPSVTSRYLRLCMPTSLLNLVSSLAGTKTRDASTPVQGWLIPEQPLQPVATPAPKVIRLPKAILRIEPNEELSRYLSRVAAAAMAAATKTYGSAQTAALRLGTALPDGSEFRPRPTLGFTKR